MTGAIATPRYSAEDFETASIRSTAPSYISEAPSYHSTAPYPEAVPAYTPPVRGSLVAAASSVPQSTSGTSTPRQAPIGLPPVPAAPLRSVPNLNNFRISTWSSVTSNPAARHYHSVAQRRVTAQRDPVDSLRRVMTDRTIEESQEENRQSVRPLEDPYLVGEVAATRARQERISRESGDDILEREDRQWDWFLAQMKDWDERERSWVRYRREVDTGHRKKLLRRIGGRRLM